MISFECFAKTIIITTWHYNQKCTITFKLLLLKTLINSNYLAIVKKVYAIRLIPETFSDIGTTKNVLLFAFSVMNTKHNNLKEQGGSNG